MIKTFIRICCLAIGLAVLTSCGGAKLSKADEAYSRGEYFDAQKIYRKLYNQLTKASERPLRGEVAYKMGLCYNKLNMAPRASASFQNALRYKYEGDPSLPLLLAQNLQAEGKYPQAVAVYQQFIDTLTQDGSPRRQAWLKEAQAGLAGARLGAQKPQATRYQVSQPKIFNSTRSDYAPQYLDRSLDRLYFTSTNEKVTGNNRSEITGMKNGDIYVSKKDEQGRWQKPEPAEGSLNTDRDEGICAFSPDGSTMYLTKARREPNAHTGVEIYTSQRSDATWSEPQKLEITADTVSSYGHPAVSPDGNWLYFASDMAGGEGGLDLWRINLRDRVGSLENLGPWINTPGDETFPYMRTDSLLYFASDGHPGLGGLDIFKAHLTPSGGWEVTNMGKPMNSAGDDFGITFGEGENGYFSSNRGDARGYDHIYQFTLPDLKILITGWVLDRDEEPVPNAVIRIVGNDGSNQKAVARADGSFKFPLQRGVDYVMQAGAKGYLNARQQFTSDIAEEDAEYGVDFILASITKPVVIDNIFYDFDRATLRPESRTALDSMAQVLRDNPNVTIEMASHTDRVGTPEYNIGLSQRRAQSVIDYLIAQGISPDRLQAQGYGKSRPKTITKRLARLHPQFKEGDVLDEKYIDALSDEDKEVADQINRRTEFQVLSIAYQMY